jgi:hypothetical protein
MYSSKKNKTKNALKGWIKMKTNLKNRFKKTMVLGLGLLMIVGAVGTSGISAFASGDDFGAAGALSGDEFTLEEMLDYAIEDEYLAKAEYEKIMETYGEQRPFSNILEAEKTHIELLLPLFAAYGIDVPLDTATDHTVIPGSVEEALEVGVQAEIDNIAMYEKFLAVELPEDVREVFEDLKKASESHLTAFQRGTSRSGGTGEGYGINGNGQNSFNGKGNGNMAEMRGLGNGEGTGTGSGFANESREVNRQSDEKGNGIGNGNGYGLGNGMVRAGRGR